MREVIIIIQHRQVSSGAKALSAIVFAVIFPLYETRNPSTFVVHIGCTFQFVKIADSLPQETASDELLSGGSIGITNVEPRMRSHIFDVTYK